MVVIIVLAYVVVGAVDIYLWRERPWQKVVPYLVLLSFAATLSVLIFLFNDLPVPQPLGALGNWLKERWAGGGAK